MIFFTEKLSCLVFFVVLNDQLGGNVLFTVFCLLIKGGAKDIGGRGRSSVWVFEVVEVFAKCLWSGESCLGKAI